MLAPFIALTDWRWFEYLRDQVPDGRVDEASFWSPRSTRPLKRFRPGKPVFMHLKNPRNAIAG